MPTYTDDELERLITSGDAQKNDDGSITWAVNNSLDKKPGTWLRRPPKAAPLITEETGAEMADLRKAARRQAVEAGITIGIQAALESDIPLTGDEAVMVLASKVAEAAMDVDRKDFARVIEMALELMEAKPQKKIEIDQRRQTIDMSNSSVQILQDSPAIQRLLEGNGATD